MDAFPTSRVEELCGYLLLHQGQVQERESLIRLLWPHDAGANGRGRLSTTLWRLRQFIDELGVPAEHCLKAAGDSVLFAPEPPPVIDVTLFERCLARAAAAADPAGEERWLRQAHRLYRGPLCEGIYNDWCLIERERLARAHLGVMGRIMAFCLERRDFEEAISMGEKILAEDPLREEVHRALIRGYGEMGLPSEAARQFQRCANSLMAELHIRPLPETVAAYHQAVFPVYPQTDRPEAFQEAFQDFMQAASRLLAIMDREALIGKQE